MDVLRLRIRRGTSAGTVVTLALALVATVFGVGALGRAANVHDGSVWLWSSKKAQVSRVNAQSGRVDLRQPVIDSRGDRVRVTQNDRYLILHDLVTGRVTSVDLKSLGFSGRLDVGARGDFRFVLGEHGAFIVDRVTGEIRMVNPATLQPTGESLRLPGPLIGGEFDTYGVLWVVSPGQGTAIGVRIAGGRPAVAETVPVAKPGRELAVTVLDRGVLTADRDGRELVAVSGGKARRITSPVTLAGAAMPDRTAGSLAAVTVPASRTVVSVADVVEDGHDTTTTRLDDSRPGTAVPFSGRLYVPDSDGSRVRVYQPGGRQVGVITVPGGRGGLELQVLENSLFINDPGGSNAAVVGSDGKVKVIDKDEGPSTIGGDRTRDPSPSASPQDPPSGEPHDRRDPPPNRPEDRPERSRPPLPRPTIEPTPGPTAKPTKQPGPQPSESGTPTPGPTADPTTDPTAPPSPSAPPEAGAPPGAPVPVTALAGDGQVKVSWPQPNSPDAPIDSYRVTWNGGARTVPGGQLETTVTGLSNGTKYRFRVTATNRYGTGPFAQSEEVTPTATRPGVPTGVWAEVNGTTVTVCWDPVEGADNYSVISTNHDGGATYPTRTAGASPLVNGRVELKISNMPGGSWSFTVVARNASGGSGDPSAQSNVVRVTDPDPTPPPADDPPTRPDPFPSTPPESGGYDPEVDVTPGGNAGGDSGGDGGVIGVDPPPDDGKPGQVEPGGPATP